jgi:hypothetical protein
VKRAFSPYRLFSLYIRMNLVLRRNATAVGLNFELFGVTARQARFISPPLAPNHSHHTRPLVMTSPELMIRFTFLCCTVYNSTLCAEENDQRLLMHAPHPSMQIAMQCKSLLSFGRLFIHIDTVFGCYSFLSFFLVGDDLEAGGCLFFRWTFLGNLAPTS